MKRKPPGYWREPDNFDRELNNVIDTEYKDEERNVIKQRGEFPTPAKLREIKRGDLLSAFRHHGQIYSVMQRMGFELPKKPRGYWQDLENFDRELREVIDTEYKDEEGNVIKPKGEFPTTAKLREIKRMDLLSAFKYHGPTDVVMQRMGLVMQRMGFEPVFKPPGYWQDPDNFERELRDVIDSEYKDEEGNVIKPKGEFPTRFKCREIKRGNLISGFRNHGQIYSVMQRMGFELPKKPRGYWQDPANFEGELREVIDTEYKDEEGNVIKPKGEFPTTAKLKEIKRGNLLSGFRNHGQIYSVMQRMGFELPKKPRGYWQDLENFDRELREVIDTEYKDEEGNVIKPGGEFPKAALFKEINKSSLFSAFKYHRGFNSVRNRMGFESVVKPPGYWKVLENFERELREVIDTEYKDEEGNVIKPKGEFPTQTILIEIKKR